MGEGESSAMISAFFCAISWPPTRFRTACASSIIFSEGVGYRTGLDSGSIREKEGHTT